MKEYTIELRIISDTPPDWIVPAIEECLEDGERVAYFDYTIKEQA